MLINGNHIQISDFHKLVWQLWLVFEQALESSSPLEPVCSSLLGLAGSFPLEPVGSSPLELGQEPKFCQLIKMYFKLNDTQMDIAFVLSSFQYFSLHRSNL